MIVSLCSFASVVFGFVSLAQVNRLAEKNIPEVICIVSITQSGHKTLSHSMSVFSVLSFQFYADKTMIGQYLGTVYVCSIFLCHSDNSERQQGSIPCIHMSASHWPSPI